MAFYSDPDPNSGLYSQLLGFGAQRRANERMGIMNQLAGIQLQNAPQMAQLAQQLELARILNQQAQAGKHGDIGQFYQTKTRYEPLRAQSYASNQFAGANLRNERARLAPLLADSSIRRNESSAALNDIRARLHPTAVLSAMTRNVSPMGRLSIEAARAEKGLAPSGVPWAAAITPEGLTQQEAPGVFQSLMPQPQQTQGGNSYLPQAMQGEQPQEKPWMPKSSQHLHNQYLLGMLKGTTDYQNREAVLKAKQIGTTINAVDFNTISKYFGPAGQAEAARDKTLALQGKPPEDYKKYYRFIKVQGPEIAKQLRAYFKDSIQPEVAKQYEHLVHPDFWMNSPELAMEHFDELVNAFVRDSDIRTEATTNPGIFTEKEELKPVIPKTSTSNRTSQAPTPATATAGKMSQTPIQNSGQKNAIQEMMKKYGMNETEAALALKKYGGSK